MPKSKKYSQLRALLAITKASLISSLNNPSTIVFSIVFPFIFILVFGFIGGGGGSIKVAPSSDINKDNPIYKALESNSAIKFVTDKSNEQIEEDLKYGRIDAKLDIDAQSPAEGCQQTNSCIPKVLTNVTTSTASPQNGALFTSIVNSITDKINLSTTNPSNLPAQVTANEISGRKFKTIDFILPGQLGFSLLSIGIFATAFVFVALRETLVLKRFFATPINRINIILGEGLSRLLFSIVQASIIIGVGTLWMDYTLIHGWKTLLSMLVLSSIGLIVFLGFGFLVSGVAKDENAIPPLANLITLPQFLLSGTFFSTSNFPSWLQPVSNALPLTHLNNAMRAVAFEGQSLFAVADKIGYLLIWGVIVYILAIKFFRWE